MENAELEIYSLIHLWKQVVGKALNEVQRVVRNVMVLHDKECVFMCMGVVIGWE